MNTHQVLVGLESVALAQHLDRLGALVDVGAKDGIVLVEVQVEETCVDRRLLEEGLRSSTLVCMSDRSSLHATFGGTYLDVYFRPSSLEGDQMIRERNLLRR